ncbi:MAG: ACT domain-containing protein [Halieaceae bacterium]|nr:ACT domain-containing protein [Halieaceae bacterium]
MPSTFIITFIGDDRPGLVEALSTVVADHGGNWLESRLSQLAGKFAGLISVSLPSESGPALEAALDALHAEGISVRVTPCDSSIAQDDHQRIVTLTVLGPDRPGVVREVSAALSKLKINVVDMESFVSPAPMSSEPLFQAQVEAVLPTGCELEALEESLDQIADEMHMDITLEAPAS